MEIFNIIQKTILALKSGFHKKILPSCNICKFKTNERKLLVIHMDTHHGQFEQLQTAINRIKSQVVVKLAMWKSLHKEAHVASFQGRDASVFL